MESLLLLLLRMYVLFMAAFFLYCLVVMPSTQQQLAHMRTRRVHRRRGGPPTGDRRSGDPWVQYVQDEPAGRLSDQLPVDGRQSEEMPEHEDATTREMSGT